MRNADRLSVWAASLKRVEAWADARGAAFTTGVYTVDIYVSTNSGDNFEALGVTVPARDGAYDWDTTLQPSLPTFRWRVQCREIIGWVAAGERDFATGRSIPGVRTRRLGGDLMRLAAAFTRGPDRLGLLRRSLSNPEKARECDDWSLSDPLPFLAWAVRQCGNKLLGKQPDALPGVWC